jgi:hypothetical protein
MSGVEYVTLQQTILWNVLQRGRMRKAKGGQKILK